MRWECNVSVDALHLCKILSYLGSKGLHFKRVNGLPNIPLQPVLDAVIILPRAVYLSHPKVS